MIIPMAQFRIIAKASMIAFIGNCMLLTKSYAVEDCSFKIQGKEVEIAAISSRYAKLKTLLIPINLKSPKQDALIRLQHGDYRIIKMDGYRPLPQIKENETRQLLCQLGERFIEGGGNYLESELWIDLVVQFQEYTLVYNETIILNWETYRQKQDMSLDTLKLDY